MTVHFERRTYNQDARQIFNQRAKSEMIYSDALFSFGHFHDDRIHSQSERSRQP